MEWGKIWNFLKKNTNYDNNLHVNKKKTPTASFVNVVQISFLWLGTCFFTCKTRLMSINQSIKLHTQGTQFLIGIVLEQNKLRHLHDKRLSHKVYKDIVEKTHTHTINREQSLHKVNFEVICMVALNFELSV